MPYNKLAQNVFGTIGTICWSAQIVPQIWKTWRMKSTKGLSETLLLVWGLSSFPLGTYAILQNINIPLIVQPQLFGALCFISWAQCQYYGRGRPLRTCIIAYIAMLAVVGGLEVGMVYVVRPAVHRGNEAPVTFFGVMASVLLGAGLLPQYYQIWKLKEVIGLSIPFMLIDCAGGVFNDLSLVFKEEFDVLAGVSYSLIVVMDLVVIVAALILNPRAERKRRAMAVAANDPPVTQPEKAVPDVKLPEEKEKTERPVDDERVQQERGYSRADDVPV